MRILLIGLLAILTSCAGYHFVESDNPLAQYGIRSISIPMFVNYTVVPGASAPMTREIAKMLSQYPGLKIYVGENRKADAVLVGTLSSDKRASDFYKTTAEKFTTGELKESIGSRKEFYIPSQTSYKMDLNLILIKDPTILDKKLLESDMKKFMNRHPRVVFSETIPLNASFTRSVDANLSPDQGGAVNYTRNKGLFNKSLETLAQSAAATFKEVILNAF